MLRGPEVSFYGPVFTACFVLNISHLTMISIYNSIQLNEVPLIDAYLRTTIETKPRSKTRERLRFVAFSLLGHLVLLAIALGIHYVFFVK